MVAEPVHESPSGTSSVVLRPQALQWVAIVALFSAGVAIGAYWATHADAYSSFGNVFMPAGTMMMVIIAIDGAQRRYEISRTNAQVRFLGRWKSYDLSTVDVLHRNRHGQLEFLSSGRRKPILRLPRDYAREDTIRRLKDLWERGLTTP